LAKNLSNNAKGYIPRNYVAVEVLETEEWVWPLVSLHAVVISLLFHSLSILTVNSYLFPGNNL
jgi:hypothetical protein